MSERYNPHDIEPKWQAAWDAEGLYKTVELDDRPNWYAFTPSDASARFKRMNGYNVFFPIGFDAFGLPAENAAIKRGIHPKIWTTTSIVHMRQQFRTMGTMIDWTREVSTCDPSYYKWNQWFFLQFLKS